MLKINQKISIKLSINNPSQLAIFVGEGSKREEIHLNKQLCSWLLEHRDSKSQTDFEISLIDCLQVNAQQASEIIKNLIDTNILIPIGEEEENLSEKQWNEWGWRDALDFHSSTRDMIWRHDYSGNPQVMTWYQYDRRVMPAESKPKGKQLSQDWQLQKLDPPSPKLTNIQYSEVLHKRRTARHFANKTIPYQDFNDLLAFSFGYTGSINGKKYRATPSYSLGRHFSSYPVIVNVENLDAGVYYYDDEQHGIAKIKTGDFSDSIQVLSQNGDFLKGISCVFFLTVHWDQYMWKYRYPRAYRFPFFEIAGVAQTLLLVAEGLGMKTFLTPAVLDSGVKELLNLPDDLVESPIYLVGVGYK